MKWQRGDDGTEIELTGDQLRGIQELIATFKMFRVQKGRDITQGEVDEALRKSGLWDRGVRIQVPFGRGQA